MESPNSLIILIPLLNSNNLNSFSTKSFKSVSYLQHDREKNFGSWEKLDILKTKPVDRKNKELKKYYCRTILPNKINITLTFFHLKSKADKKAKKENFYFIELELYSANRDINYKRIINYYYHHKIAIFEFINAIIKELNPIHIDIANELIKSYSNLPLIHFNIVYYNCKIDNIITNLKELYFTRIEIVNDSQFNISADTQGMSILYINKLKTLRSGYNLKNIVIRCFLLRFFTWLFDSKSQNYLNLRRNFFSYYKYLLNTSRNRDIYSRLKDLKTYCFDLRLELAIFDTNNQSKFLKQSDCESYLRDIEKFLNSYSIHHFSLLKYALITEKTYNPKVLNILEKNNWNLIRSF